MSGGAGPGRGRGGGHFAHRRGPVGNFAPREPGNLENRSLLPCSPIAHCILTKRILIQLGQCAACFKLLHVCKPCTRLPRIPASFQQDFCTKRSLNFESQTIKKTFSNLHRGASSMRFWAMRMLKHIHTMTQTGCTWATWTEESARAA